MADQTNTNPWIPSYDPNQWGSGLDLSTLIYLLGQGISGPGVTGGPSYEIQHATTGQPSINLVDVRTPGIKVLEQAGLGQMLSALLNPYGFAQQGQAMSGATPARAAGNTGLAGAAGGQTGLWQMLFGQGGGLGQGQAPWTPPARGGGAGGTAPTVSPTAPDPGSWQPTTNPPPSGPNPGAAPVSPSTFPQWPGFNPVAMPGGNPPPSLPANPTFNPQGAPNPPGTSLDRNGIDLSSMFQWLIANDAPMFDAAGNPVTDPTKAASVWDTTQPYDQAGAISAADQALYDALLAREGANPFESDKGLGVSAGGESWLFPFTSFRAGGGPLDPRGVTVVGERGPEAIVPTAQGQQVVPLGIQQMLGLLMGGARGMATGGLLDETLVNSGGFDYNPNIGTTTTDIDPNMGQFSASNQPAGGAIGQTLAFNPELDAFNSLKQALSGGWGQQANQAYNLGAGFTGNLLGSDPTAADTGNLRSLANIGLTPQGGEQINRLSGLGGTGIDTSGLQQLGSGTASILGGNNIESLTGLGGNALSPQLVQSLMGSATGANPGQGVVDAMQPVFQQNLTNAFGQLRSSAPSIFNSAQQLQGTDLSRQALNDFNLMAAQALQTGVGQQQNAASILSQLLGQERSLQQGALGTALQGQLSQSQLGQSDLERRASALGQAGQLQGTGLGLQQNALASALQGLLSQSQLGQSDLERRAAASSQAGQLGLGGLGQQISGLGTFAGMGQAAGQGDISALQTLLSGAGQAGAGQFGRLAQAGQLANTQEQQAEQARQFNQQYDLAAQQQQWNQMVNPTLQLLLAAMQMAEPTALQTVVGSQKA